MNFPLLINEEQDYVLPIDDFLEIIKNVCGRVFEKLLPFTLPGSFDSFSIVHRHF